MSKESDVAGRLNDATLLATLTGGIFQYSTVGVNGITRETAAAAFDGTTLYLKPCCLVKQRGMVPDGNLQDEMTQQISVRQTVETWIYADSGAGYTAIDSAMARIYTLLYGYTFATTFPLQLVNVLDRMRDEGSLKHACMARMDWLIVSVFA